MVVVDEQGTCQHQKISPRSKVDIAAVNVGAMVVVDEQGTCQQARICLGAVGPVPLRASTAEEFLNSYRERSLPMRWLNRPGPWPGQTLRLFPTSGLPRNTGD